MICFRKRLFHISKIMFICLLIIIYSNTSPNRQTLHSKKRKETIEIAQKIHINYKYCHHCKQRKPGEVTLQCKFRLFDGKGTLRPYKAFFINNTIVIRSIAIYLYNIAYRKQKLNYKTL